MTRQIILAAHFPGVNNTTVWSDPAAGSQIEFESFRRLAQTAERGFFDFFFLAEGLRLREQRGRIHDLDVVGRPDNVTVLAGLAAVTDHLGLTGTVNSTFNEPQDIARRLSTLDHLSGGRAGWNVVTSWDAFTGENFRKGGYLDRADRYTRAEEVLAAVRALWAARGADRPVILQAGDSDRGREFAARDADAIFSRHGTLEAGKAFYADVKGRLARHGRRPDDLKILPAATFILGDSDAEAQEKAHHVRRQQVSPQTAILLLEQLWNKDLSDLDPEGPLPPFDPVLDDDTIIKGRAGMFPDRIATANEWRAIAEERRLGVRDLVIEVTGRQSFIGTPETIAATLVRFVDESAADGFILVPHIVPGGLDEFVDQVVPRLQERGALRTEYSTATLRGHLGLAG